MIPNPNWVASLTCEFHPHPYNFDGWVVATDGHGLLAYRGEWSGVREWQGKKESLVKQLLIAPLGLQCELLDLLAWTVVYDEKEERCNISTNYDEDIHGCEQACRQPGRICQLPIDRALLRKFIRGLPFQSVSIVNRDAECLCIDGDGWLVRIMGLRKVEGGPEFVP